MSGAQHSTFADLLTARLGRAGRPAKFSGQAVFTPLSNPPHMVGPRGPAGFIPAGRKIGQAPGVGALNPNVAPQGQHANVDLPAKLSQAQAASTKLSSVGNAINAALSTASSNGQSDQYGGVAALQQIQADLATLQGSLWNGQNFGSFQGSTGSWNAMDQATSAANADIQQYGQLANQITSGSKQAQQQAQQAQQQAQAAQQVVQQARSQALNQMNAGNFAGALALLQSSNVSNAASAIGYDLSSDISAVVSAKAASDAKVQAAADASTISRARSSALALMNQGNFGGALAAVQSQNVTDAASRQNFDLTPDIQAITGAQQNSQNQQAQQQALAAQQAAAQQAQAQAAQQASQNQLAIQTAQIAAQQQAAQIAAQQQSDQLAAQQAQAAAQLAAQQQAQQAQIAAQQQAAAAAQANAPPPAWIQNLLPTILAQPAPQPQQVPQGAPQNYAPVTSGPSQSQLQALALLQAFGGSQGQSLAAALSSVFAPQGSLSPGGASVPDGTPCAMADGSAGIYQGGNCVTVGPPDGIVYGAPTAAEGF